MMVDNQETAIRRIAWAGMNRPEFEQPIITPFVIPTVLAALWSVLRHPDSWPKAVATAFGLGGDVDTLGAIVGALMGAKLGVAGIPGHLTETVLDADRIRSLAIGYDALVEGQQTRVLKMTPSGDNLRAFAKDECPFCHNSLSPGKPVGHWDGDKTTGFLYTAKCEGCGTQLVGTGKAGGEPPEVVIWMKSC